MSALRFAVLGDPIGHSRSPQMHGAAFSALGLPHRYERRLVPRGQLRAALGQARDDGLRGVNLTVPHKVDALACVDRLDAAAERIGAVNTVDIEADEFVGRNTDAAGFVRGLETQGVPMPSHAIVLGGGGAARAIVFGLLDAMPVTVHWVSRRFRDADPAQSGDPTEGGRLRRTGYEALLGGCAADLLVNATIIGMVGGPPSFPIPLGLASMPADAVVCDIVVPTPNEGLLAEAKRRDLRTVDWRPMLVGQGILALEGWLGLHLPMEAISAMSRAL